MIQLPCPEVYYGSHRFAPDSPPVPAGGLFLYGSDLSPRSSCFNDGYPSPQALIPGEPTRTVCRILGNNSPPFFFCINPRSLDFSKVVNPAVPPRLFALLD